jgi:uncharacterized protein with GYD domain
MEPELRGDPVLRELTLAELAELYLDRHAMAVRPRTIVVLRERLAYAIAAFGDVPLRDLERMSGDIAAWQAKLPERSRYGIVSALRQTLGAAVRWEYLARNPATLAGRNPQPPPRPVRAYTRAEVDAIATELVPSYRPLPIFAAATGLRPEEWLPLERRDVDRQERIVNVRRTVSSGEVVELGKTNASRRQVPLSQRALAALDDLPPRLDTPLLFAGVRGGVLNLANFRRRESPARADATAQLAERLGGKLVELYWTVGPYDIVAIFEAPDDETATAMQLTVGTRGSVRTTTLRAFDREEIEKILAKIG